MKKLRQTFCFALCMLLFTGTMKAQEWPKPQISTHAYIIGGYDYEDKEGGQNGCSFKLAIAWAEVKLTDKWDFMFMYEFNKGQLLDTYVTYKPSRFFNFRFGQFKTPFTIENPMSPRVVEVINFYSQPTSFMAGVNADPLYGGKTGRDWGLMMFGNLIPNKLDYELAVMQGQGLNTKDGNNKKDLNGDLTWHVTKELNVMGTFQLGKGHAIAESPYNPDIAVGEDYTRNRWSIGLTYKPKWMSLRSEYMGGKDGKVNMEGAYATASIPLIKKLDAILHTDWMCYNRDLHQKTNSYMAGLQYWFYPKNRLQLQFTRFNPAFGEKYNAVQMQFVASF